MNTVGRDLHAPCSWFPASAGMTEGKHKEISYLSAFVLCSFLSRIIRLLEGIDMPSKRRPFLKRLVRALPVVLAAAPGVIDAVQQARRALRDSPDPSPKIRISPPNQ